MANNAHMRGWKQSRRFYGTKSGNRHKITKKAGNDGNRAETKNVKFVASKIPLNKGLI